MVAWVVAAVAMIGALGWVTAPVIVGVSTPAVSTGVLFGLTVLVGIGAYAATRTMMRRLLRPLTIGAEMIGQASAAPRGHALMVQRALRCAVDDVAVTEVKAFADAVVGLVKVIESRHARQTAWTVAVVHDAKAPIAASANSLRALAASPRLLGTDEAVLLGKLELELRQLGVNVQRMIDVARFDRDEVDLRLERLDLGALARQVCERVRSRFGVTVTCSGEATSLGDASLLSRALENLISNASRHARSRVVVEVLPGLVRIVDDGEGLADSLDVLSSPFRSRATHVAGVEVSGAAGGIGLFLARRVLELHGGRLVVESTGANGTVFLAYVGQGGNRD